MQGASAVVDADPHRAPRLAGCRRLLWIDRMGVHPYSLTGLDRNPVTLTFVRSQESGTIGSIIGEFLAGELFMIFISTLG